MRRALTDACALGVGRERGDGRLGPRLLRHVLAPVTRARQAIVQATEDASAAPGAPPPQDTTYAILHLDTVYAIDLASGSWRRIGDVPRNDPATGPVQAELPVWFPSGDRVAYWTIESGCMVIKVRNAATAADVLTIKRNGTTGCYQPQRGILDGPRFHTAVSHDSSRLLIPGQMQIYDSRSGALIADLHQKVMDGLAAAGYSPDARYPGQGGGGTFPLAGTFTADDKAVVFDGAVQKGGTYGVILCRINVDGTGFTVVRAPITVEPQLSNNHNYSQLNPHWR